MSEPTQPTSPEDWTPEQVRRFKETYLKLARDLSAGAVMDAAFRRFLAAYPGVHLQTPTDLVRAAFDRAAAPFTDPGVIVAAAEQYAMAVRAGEVLDREVATDTFWLESRQFMAWLPPKPGGAAPPTMVPVLIVIGDRKLTTAVGSGAAGAVYEAIGLILCGADKPHGGAIGSDRCRS